MWNNYNVDDKPLISVIIPTYNCREFLSEAIQSALNQSYRPIEVIVCDDGSTDDTAQLLRTFGDTITVIQGKHKGVSAARNSAIAASRGEYLAFLDADDCWLPDKIRLQVESMLESPAAVVCHTGCELFGAEQGDGPIESARRERIQGKCFDRLFFANGIVLSSALVRRTAFPLEGFDTNLSGPEDYDLFMRILFDAEALYLPDILTRYRRHQTQATADGAKRIQVQVNIARLNTLRRFADRIDTATYDAMYQFSLEELKVCTYSRYWQRDWKSSIRGFHELRNQGVAIPLLHRLKAWTMYRLGVQ